MTPGGHNLSIGENRVMRTECGFGTGDTVYYTEDGGIWISSVAYEDRNKTGVTIRKVVTTPNKR